MSRWKAMDNGYYEFSDEGECRRVIAEQGTYPLRVLTPSRNAVTGYYSLTFSVKNVKFRKYLHRVMLETFVGPCPDGMEATHINGDKSDNRLVNLRWATHLDNIADKDLHGTTLRGSAVGNSKLTEEQAVEILHADGFHYHIAARYNISRTTVTLIKNRKIWRHIT
jgi:hypothetical protein